MWRCVVVLVCGAGCATGGAAVQSEGLTPEQVAALGPGEALSNDELAQAWASEAPGAAGQGPRRAEPAPVTTAAGPERGQRHRAALAAGRAALEAGKLDEAAAAASEVVAGAAVLTGRERHEAGQLAFAVERARGSSGAALEAALAWRRGCGPQELDACRAKALAALGQLPGKDAKDLRTLLREAEGCLAGKEPLACLGKVDRAARLARDEVLAGRAGLARAMAEKDEARRLAALGRVEDRCTAPGCLTVRRRALAAVAALATGQGDSTAAVRALIKENQLAASAVEPELRPWVRSSQLDEACQRLDAAEGAGACRRLEKAMVGSWSFRDFSQKKAGTGLPVELVREVNQHYAPLLEACLTEEARRLGSTEGREYEVSWAVHNDGRVYDAHLRSDLDRTPLADCLRAQFALWRYPRFDGEYQHVQQRFNVRAGVRSATWR